MIEINLAIALDLNRNRMVLHYANCGVVRRQAAQGVPVLTMYRCQLMPERNYLLDRCECLDADYEA
jgi:hypothetical protein